MGEIYTDRRIRVHGGGQLAGHVPLPRLDSVEPVRDPLPDRLGRPLADRPGFVLGSAAIGGLLGAAMSGGGLVRRSVIGSGAAAAAFAGALLTGALAARVTGTSSPTTDAHVQQDTRVHGARAGGKPERLRVMDWNVRELIGDDGLRRTDDAAIEAVRAVVRRERPDVLVLQEVSRQSLLGGFSDGLGELARDLGATDAVLVPNGMRVSGKEKGNAILTFGQTRLHDARGLRHPDAGGDGTLRRLQRSVFWLEELGIDLPPSLERGYHPRTTADAMLTTPAGRAIRLLDVHLSGTGSRTGGTPGSTDAQDRQLLPLLATIDAWQGPTIIAGDFNVRSGTPNGDHEARLLQAAGLRDAFTTAGIAASNAKERGSFQGRRSQPPIDRIYASEDVGVSSARVLRDPVARAGSDHLPVVADLELG